MDKVNVYIDVYFRGRANKGTGIYTIVLEAIGKSGVPKTKEFVRGVTETTKNRTAMLAVIEAFEHFNRACKVAVHINNQYVTNAMNQDYSKAKNSDLWEQLIELSAIHETTYYFTQQNAYSKAMETTMKHMEIEFKNDNGNEF